MGGRIAACCVVVMAMGVAGHAADEVRIQSPDGTIQVHVFGPPAQGRLCYSVKRTTSGSTALLNVSPLGITIDGIDLGADSVKLGEVKRSSVQERYAWRGVHAEAVNHYNGAEIAVTHEPSKTAFTLEFRVFNDGVAYRYVVPGSGRRTIGGEASAWNLPTDCRIWYQTNVNNYEGIYAQARPGEIRLDEKIGFPVTIAYADGTYGALTEAEVFAYSGLTVRATGATILKGVFEDDRQWEAEGTIRSPWRVLMTGPDLNALVNCDIVHNLCPAPEAELFPDGIACAWIKPGRSLWNWWSDSSVKFPDQKAWVDQAAKMGVEYYLVDAGWEKEWQLPDKDKWACLKDLCDYGKARGVGINVWKFWGELQVPQARRDFFAACVRAGAVGVKIDFMDSESRQRIEFYTETLKDAARARLMINFHGANKPTGEDRTFPNEMTREGIRGLEYNKWGALPAMHYATLPFTRYLAGHGDFTPCTFNPDRLKGTTATLQLASAIAYTSPLMHWADHWTRYTDSNVLDVVEAVAATWDETIVLPGSQIGEVAALARRSGDDWFVGVINGGSKRPCAFDLSFLGEGAYRGVLVRDVAGQPAQMAVERTTVRKGQRLEATLETGGGFVAWLVRRP